MPDLSGKNTTSPFAVDVAIPAKELGVSRLGSRRLTVVRRTSIEERF
jgi:hypothetical protein